MTAPDADRPVDVVVVGGGPAGLAAAAALRRARVERVVVVEREGTAGGVPRHTDHTGFGLRDRRRLLRGPAYAEANVAAALAAGVELRTGTTVVGWDDTTGTTTVVLATPAGVRRQPAGAVVLATGTRERPRSARLVPGDRPAGVHTTAAIQQLVHLAGVHPGRRAVIVGAEHVSFSAIDTLARAGCRTVAVVTPHDCHQTYAPLVWWSATRRRVPVLTGVEVTAILGARRVEAVRLSDGRTIGCDTVVVSGDWIAEHEVARCGGIVVDMRSHAPLVDAAGRTSREGVFAAGNVVHGALQADWCANEGTHVAAAVAAFLEGGAWPDDGIAVEVRAPLRWVSPGRLRRREAPAAGRLVLVADVAARWPVMRASQGGRVLARSRSRTPVAPGRPFTIDAGVVGRLDPDGGPLVLEMEPT